MTTFFNYAILQLMDNLGIDQVKINIEKLIKETKSFADSHCRYNSGKIQYIKVELTIKNMEEYNAIANFFQKKA